MRDKQQIDAAGNVLAPGQEEARKSAVLSPAEQVMAAAAGGAGRIEEEQTSSLSVHDKNTLNRKIAASVAALVVIFLASMCIIPELGAGFASPDRVIQAVGMHISLGFQALSGHPSSMTSLEIIEQCPMYYQVETRFAVSLVTIICGVLLALAGSLYQMTFRNPIVAPTMLGVSNGVSMGVVFFVLTYQTAALYMNGMRWVYSYAGAVIVLLAVLGITKAVCGKGKAFSIFELLLVGTIFSQVCGGIVQIIQDNVMSDELWEVYQQVSEAMNTTITTGMIAVVVIVALVTCVPLFLMRFSLNIVAFTDRDARLMGLDSSKLKIVCLVMGTVMVITAQVTVGTVSMISLVVPFISRALFGTEFKHQMWGDILLGSILLLVCRDFVLLFPFFGTELTLSSVVGFVTLPLYVWIIASRQKGWK